MTKEYVHTQPFELHLDTFESKFTRASSLSCLWSVFACLGL